MKNKIPVLVMLAALISCTKNEISHRPPGDVEIMVRTTLIKPTDVVTRAPFEGDIQSSNQLIARVVTSKTNNFEGAPYLNGTMTFKGANATGYNPGFMGVTTSPTFPGDVNQVYLFGLHPENWSVTHGGGANITFTGKEDVMASEKVTTQKEHVIAGEYQKLTFKHLLTRLEVKLSGTENAIANVGKITGIRLVGDISGTGTVKNQMTVTNDGSSMLATPSGAITSMTFYGLGLGVENNKIFQEYPMPAYDLTSTPTFAAYSMVAPVTATAINRQEYFLAIDTQIGGTKYIAIDLMNAESEAFSGNTAGSVFMIHLNFISNEQIMVSAEVQPWIEGGEWGQDLTI